MNRHFPLVSFSVDKRVTITMLILIIVVFGLLSLSRLGLDMLPDITFPMVTVVTQYSGVAPEEIEQLITVPLEGTIAGVNGVKKVSSKSSEGISAITVEFEWGTNLDYAAQDIKDNIDFVRDFLPEDMTEPVVFKFNLSQIPIMFVGVTGPYDTYRLKKLLEDNVRERIQRLDGVAQAAVFGEKSREIRVALDPARLKYKNISIDGVIQSLRGQNANTPAGYFQQNHTDFLFRAIGEFTARADIEDAIVGSSPQGMPIRLREVATVVDTFKEQRNRTKMNGEESVFLVINKRSGANTLKVSQRVNKEIEAIKTSFPELKFVEIFDQGGPVQKITRATSMNALIGGVLAILFMFGFLLNVRPTIAIAVAIPLSIITTFIAIYAAGFTLNLMTLGGLALGVGMLVDNAIVVIENIYRHLEHGTPRAEAAKRGASEVAMAITASTFTTVVVFLPILFSQGLASQLFRGVALTIIFSLLSSLFVALTIVPMLSSVLFKARRTHETTAGWFTPIRTVYVRILSRVLNRPGITLGAVLLAVVISGVIGVRFLGREFMPAADSNRFLMRIDLPIGTTLEETERIVGRIATRLREMPEVRIVGEIIGRSETERGGDAADITGPHSAQLFVRLVESDERRKSEKEIQDRVRSILPDLRDANFTFQSMGAMGSSGKPVKVNVYGKDLEVLEEISRNLEVAIQGVEGLRDIESSFSKGRPEFHFVVNKQKALSLGLVPFMVQQTLETANLGRTATFLRTGEEEIDVRVVLEDRFRDEIEDIKNVPVQSRTGAMIPLGQVIDIVETTGPTMISRDNKFRVATIDANLVGRDLGNVVKDIRARLAPIQDALPEGYRVSYQGEFEDMQETFGQLALGLLIAVLLVYMVMASQFESLVHPLVIMITMPLSIVGVVFLLVLTGKTFSVVAFIGLVILAGIVVNNGIVLVDYTNQLRRQGMGVRDALIESGRTRIRPVLITAGTTIMGMLPMAVSTSEGSELRGPMSLTVIGGLASATLLTLVVIPVIYLLFDRAGEGVKNAARRVLG